MANTLYIEHKKTGSPNAMGKPAGIGRNVCFLEIVNQTKVQVVGAEAEAEALFAIN